MGTIKLVSLRLRNFKGVKEFECKFEGKSANIFGDNATGKTTIFDAFTWLLFDKDSSDNKNFGIKTYEKNGQVIHGIEHEVEGVLEIDGVELALRKIYKEKWTQRRGQASKELTGHTTTYYIDEVPVRKNEYTEKINALIDENIFKLITNPLYFNTSLNWKDRRNILLEVVGDITDEDVINSRKDLKKLKGLLENKDLEKFKKIIAEKKKKLNEEIKSIPYRIDELNNSIEKTPDASIDSIESSIEAKKESLEEIDDQIIDNSRIYDKNSKIKSEIYKKKDRLRNIEQQQRENALEPKKQLQQEIFKHEKSLNKIMFDIESKELKINNNISDINSLEKKREELRDSWYKENSKIFEFDESECICPTCGQNLPKENIESKKEELEARFNTKKKETLEAITTAGKFYTEKINMLNLDNEELSREIKQLNDDESELKMMVATLREQYEKISEVELIKTDEYKELETEIQELEKQIVEPDETVINNLKARKEELLQEIDKLKYLIRAIEHNEKTRKRIEDLQVRERELANMIAELEGQEFLCEEFIRTKVDLLENKINSKFKQVRFKLFNTLVNGGIEECCEALIDGVPYSDANNAAKINAGIDIINTLTERYNTTAPVFIDNRESVNDLLQSNSQVISLIVSRDKELRVEV